jgi:hypothetical protein
MLTENEKETQAKETVMSKEERSALNDSMPSDAKYGDVFKAIAEKQALISFEAGAEAQRLLAVPDKDNVGIITRIMNHELYVHGCIHTPEQFGRLSEDIISQLTAVNEARLAEARKKLVEIIENIPCVYSKEIFKNTHEEIARFLKEKGLTDNDLSAVSGVLARFGWENALYKVLETLKEVSDGNE